MGGFIKGDIVVLPFPYADFIHTKVRPALVITQLSGHQDVILCQITSQKIEKDDYSIALVHNDFSSGGLPQDSYIRPNHLYTAEPRIIIKKAGCLSSSKLVEVIKRLKEIIDN